MTLCFHTLRNTESVCLHPLCAEFNVFSLPMNISYLMQAVSFLLFYSGFSIKTINTNGQGRMTSNEIHDV